MASHRPWKSICNSSLSLVVVNLQKWMPKSFLHSSHSILGVSLGQLFLAVGVLRSEIWQRNKPIPYRMSLVGASSSSSVLLFRTVFSYWGGALCYFPPKWCFGLHPPPAGCGMHAPVHVYPLYTFQCFFCSCNFDYPPLYYHL